MDHRTIVSFFTCQLVWVNRYIGGAQIYQHYLQSGLVDELVITFVDACVASKGGGKVHFFPVNFFSCFVPCFIESKFERNQGNEHSFKIVRYIRR